jgi:probable addiction module antidote protein
MVKIEAFDAARYLGSAEAQAGLLNDALESGDAAYVAQALGVIARARGMSGVARAAGVTREALYRSLSEEGDPRLTTLLGGAAGAWGAAEGGGGACGVKWGLPAERQGRT